MRLRTLARLIPAAALLAAHGTVLAADQQLEAVEVFATDTSGNTSEAGTFTMVLP